MLRSTYTFALMEVSEATYNEVLQELKKAEYDHAILPGGHLDMHGIALVLKKSATVPEKCNCRNGCKSPTCTNC